MSDETVAGRHSRALELLVFAVPDTEPHKREAIVELDKTRQAVRDLTEQVATLTGERDRARKTASIYATGYSPDHLSDTEHESARQLYGTEVADALFPEPAPTPTEPDR